MSGKRLKRNLHMKKNQKAWGGRFSQKTSSLMDQFNASLPFDQKLYSQDIRGSLAHAQMLQSIGVLTKTELAKIKKGLTRIQKEIENNEFVFDLADEDIHMAIEKRLTSLIGPAGAKLHTGRSRNDQVALDFRLFCREKTAQIQKQINHLIAALLELAQKNAWVVMPAYTHLQRAQPTYFAHYILAYIEKFERDYQRLGDTLKRMDECPLGAGALCGSTFKLDRHQVAKELGFRAVTHNSLDTVSDRDFAVELLMNLSLFFVHTSRLCEEWVLYSSQEFSFLELPEDFSTGSSMMPQKINPDACELIRGKTGRIFGHLISLLTTLKGLPLAYNKDMQEDKPGVFDAIENTQIVLDVLIAMVPKTKVKAKNMAKANRQGFLLATDLADYLVTKKIAFREAHEIVGKLVRFCFDQGKTFEELDLKQFQKFSKAFQKDVFDWLDFEKALNRRDVYGGPAKKQVQKQIKRIQTKLKKRTK